jgi:hypothetical protein
MDETKIKRPLWIRITAYGFAAVLFASIAIGGLGYYRQSDMSEHALEAELDSDLDVLQADMTQQKHAASALALMTVPIITRRWKGCDTISACFMSDRSATIMSANSAWTA